ncbi:MAG: hypothetical protein WC188_05345 [Candidatus Caldatribacteriota bacterium]
MRKIVLTALPYFALGFLILLISIIWWPVNGGLVQLTNSWVGFFFICSFCVVFLFQEEIYIFLNQYIKGFLFIPGTPQQKHRVLPEILNNEQEFQEAISGTVLAWMEKINLEKEEKKLQENDISRALEQYQKTRQESIKWLFLFADNFLVQNSKDVLYKIYERHYVTEQIIREIINEMGIDNTELEAALEILSHMKFIKRQDEEIIITETGSAYCAYLENTIYKK